MTPKETLYTTEAKADFRNVMNYCRRYWWVMLLSVAACIGLALLYLHIKTPKYAITGSVILNDTEEESGNLPGELGALMSSFSLGGSSGKLVEDEILRLTSISNLTEVVNRLGIYSTSCSTDGIFNPKEWYYNNSPLSITYLDGPADSLKTSSAFAITVKPGGKDVTVKVKQYGKTVAERTFGSLPATISTPGGKFSISTTSFYNPAEPLAFKATMSRPLFVAQSLVKDLEVESPTKKSNIVSVVYEDGIISRGKDIVNTMFKVYNERSLAERHLQAEATVKFVDERLAELYSQLSRSESKIEDYKRRNKVVDAEAEAAYIYTKKGAMEQALVDIGAKKSLIQMIVDFLGREENKYSLIPFTEDMPPEPMVEYNKLVLNRIKILNNAKSNNTALRLATEQVDIMRQNLLTSLEKQNDALGVTIERMKREAASSDTRIEGIPSVERELTNLYRDQTIQNQIYSFLLQKREENQLKMVRDSDTGRTVDEAYESAKPVKPRKILIMALAIIFGLAAPLAAFSGIDLIKRLRTSEKIPAAD